MRKYFFIIGSLVVGAVILFVGMYDARVTKHRIDAQQLSARGGVVKGVTTAALPPVSQTLPIAHYEPVRVQDAQDLTLVNAHASLIIDAHTGTLLHYNNGREKRQIASLTKIATAILVVENVEDLDEYIKISPYSRATIGTRVGCPAPDYCFGNRLVVGERISVRDALHALLMSSANDVAVALAEHVAGSEEAFVKKMNDYARQKGLVDTHFCTASGLEPDNLVQDACYSSAYDIARIATPLFSQPQFEVLRDIMQKKEMHIVSEDGVHTHDLRSTNRLLETFPQMIGAKTGFTPSAGRSLLLAAHNGTQKNPVIAVVLDDPYRWDDVHEMVTWAFDNHRWQ